MMALPLVVAGFTAVQFRSPELNWEEYYVLSGMSTFSEV